MARVIAVEDDPLSQAILVDVLRGLGHAPVVTGSATAMREVQRSRPDLLIVSVVPPGNVAFELVESLARLPRPAPVVLLTAGGVAEAEAAVRSRGLSVSGVLAKPVDARRLGEVVASAVGSASPAGSPPDWSGITFLEAVNGPMDRLPPARVLFLAHCLDATGALAVEREVTDALVVVRGARVVHVEGVPGLLRALDPRLPDAQSLRLDFATAVAAGHPVEKVMEAAALGLGAWLVKMSGEKSGVVRWERDASAPAGAFPLPMSIPRMLAGGIRVARSSADVQRDWTALGNHAPRVRVPDDAPEARWGLDATAMRVFRLAEGAVHVDHLVRRAAGEDVDRRADVLRSLDLLRLLGLILVDGGPVSEAGAPSAAAGPPTSSGTEEDPRIVRLRTALAAMEGAHPVDVLELGERKALTEDGVSQAYRDISRRFHPDSYFAAPPVIRTLAESCFQRLNTAFDALRAPGGLSEANRFLADRAAGRGFVTERDHIAARVAFKRAESLFRVRDWKGADALYMEAARLDASTWPHAFHAMRAGALSRRLSAAEATKMLEELPVPDMKKRAEVLVAMGNIQKLEARHADAMKSYKRAIEADPENRDAQREVRLHQGRTEKAAAPPAAGVLSGFFSRGGTRKA